MVTRETTIFTAYAQ